jgi:hypothetical protein
MVDVLQKIDGSREEINLLYDNRDFCFSVHGFPKNYIQISSVAL